MPDRSFDRRALLRLGTTALLGAAGLPAARAAGFPSKPVRVVVAFTPGAAPDLLARSIGSALSRRWNTPVIVDNKLGAEGVISSEFVAKAPPDGHTLYLATMGNIALAPAVVERLPYDASKAFRGIGFIAVNPFAILLRQDSTIRSVADMVARSKQKTLNYGSGGTLAPLIGGAIARETGADFQYIPYKGAQLALTDLLGGQLDMVIADLPSLMPFQVQGKARLLAVTSQARSALAPDVPTVAESGYKEINFSTWYALVGPSGMPRDIVTQLNADLAEALRTPDVLRQMQTMGLTPQASTPEALDQLMQSEIQRWGTVVRTKR